MGARRGTPAPPGHPLAVAGPAPTGRAASWRTGATRSAALEWVAVAVLSLGAAVLLTWPLAAHLDHAAGDPFDPRFQAWTIDWVQFSLRHPAHLYDANIFRPAKSTLVYSDPLIGLAVVLLPFRWAGLTPIGVFNVGVLAGFAASSAAGYWFGRVVNGSRAAAAVTGTVFAFGTFGTYESTHVQTVFRPGVALAAALAWKIAGRETKHPSRTAAALALVIAWQCSTSFYTGAYAFVAAVVVLVARGAGGRRTHRRREAGVSEADSERAVREPGHPVLAGITAIGAALAFIAVLAIPYLSHRSADSGFHWTLRDLRQEGADFLHADSRLVVWGPLLGRGRAWPEYPPPVFPGVAVLGLGAIGLVSVARRARRDHRSVQQLLIAVALVVAGAALALGASDVGWRRYTPYRLIFSLLPGGDALRATFRGWMVGLLGLGVLAGIGADVVGRSLANLVGRRGAKGQRPSKVAPASLVTPAVAAITVALLFVEGFPRRAPLARVDVHPVDRVLAALPAGGVLYLPVGTANGDVPYLAILRETDYVYRTTAHHRPTPNGYSGFLPPSYFRMASIVTSLPGQPALAYLQAIGVRYVVFAPVAPGATWSRLDDPATAGPLRFFGRFGDDLLYELPSSAG